MSSIQTDNLDPLSITGDGWLNQVNIREVVESDLRDLEWEGEYSRYRQVYTDVYQRVRRGMAVMWVVEIPEIGLIGQAFVQLKMTDRSCANGKTRAYVHSFRVREELRGRGLGTAIMDHVEQDLAKRGFCEVTLNVAQENEGALRLYRRLGYEIAKRISGRWSFYDHKGKLQHVSEPGFRLIKFLRD